MMQQAGLTTLTLLGSAQRPLAPAHTAAVTQHWPACPEEMATLGTDMEGGSRWLGYRRGLAPSWPERGWSLALPHGDR